MLRGHAWACLPCLPVCPAWSASEAMHTLTLFGGLGVGTLGGCLGGRGWGGVRLSRATAGREQTCCGFGHGGREWRDASAATLCLWVVSGSRAVVSARGPIGKCRRKSRALFQPASGFCAFFHPASRLNLPLYNGPFHSFCTTGRRRRLRRPCPARSRRPHPPLRQDLSISGWNRISLLHPAFSSTHPSISLIRSTTTPPPSAVPKSGTTFATPPPRTRIRCARRPL